MWTICMFKPQLAWYHSGSSLYSCRPIPRIFLAANSRWSDTVPRQVCCWYMSNDYIDYHLVAHSTSTERDWYLLCHCL